MFNKNIWLPWIDLMLQHLAETEQVAKQLELVRELEVARLYGRKCKNTVMCNQKKKLYLIILSIRNMWDCSEVGLLNRLCTDTGYRVVHVIDRSYFVISWTTFITI